MRFFCEVISIFHNEKEAKCALENFERRFSKKEYTSRDETNVWARLPKGALDALCDAYGGELSKSKIRTLLGQGGVRRLDAGDETTLGADDKIKDGDLVKVGKRGLLRFKKK